MLRSRKTIINSISFFILSILFPFIGIFLWLFMFFSKDEVKHYYGQVAGLGTFVGVVVWGYFIFLIPQIKEFMSILKM